MNTSRPDIPWLDPNYLVNRQKFSPEALAPYAGQYIAWNWDNTQILDSAPTREELYAKLEAKGIDTQRVALEFIDDL
jgi:hypothetical protein